MTVAPPLAGSRAASTLRLPDPGSVFDARARRFAALARESSAAPFLELLARIARGQHAAARAVQIPAGVQLIEGAPLDHARLRPLPAWREMLRSVLASAEDGPLPAATDAAIRRLRSATAEELDAAAASALRAHPPDLATAPFLAGAMQVYFARLASGLDPELVGPGSARCPVCGAGPVAGTVAGDERLRHLCCGLCGASWHMTRVQCARCAGAAAVSYYAIEDAFPGVQAEACDDCGVYLKLFDLALRPGVDPVADDAASLALDVLLAERGYARLGANLLAASGVAE